MASILDRYGIKEVCDCTFYKLGDSGAPLYPVLYLDSLKVSTTEMTAESSEARGGKGNGMLISWDFNKEINVTLEDALFSAKSLAIMYGNGTPIEVTSDLLMRSEVFTATTTSTDAESAGWNSNFVAPDGRVAAKQNPKYYVANEKGETTVTSITQFVKGEKYFCSYDLPIAGSVIEVSATSFPGTYYVTGDTYARSDASGDDEFFQLIFPKAKVTSENTLTMEADGDPSVFNLSLKLLRPADGVMMKLIKYDVTGLTAGDAVTNAWYHNHTLLGTNEV